MGTPQKDAVPLQEFAPRPSRAAIQCPATRQGKAFDIFLASSARHTPYTRGAFACQPSTAHTSGQYCSCQIMSQQEENPGPKHRAGIEKLVDEIPKVSEALPGLFKTLLL